jgi:hypothetical protein
MITTHPAESSQFHSVFGKTRKEKQKHRKNSEKTYPTVFFSETTVNCSHFYDGIVCVNYTVNYCEVTTVKKCEQTVNWWQSEKVSSHPVHSQFTVGV